MSRFSDILRPPKKAAPRYEPKVTIRVWDDRTKQIIEFSVPVPPEGDVPDIWIQISARLRGVLRRLGYGKDDDERDAP